MASKLEKSRTYVYAFTGIAIALVLFMLVMIAINNKIFKARGNYTVYLKDAHGLHSRPTVYYKGLEVGRVNDFILTDNEKIKVEFFVYSDYENKLTNFSVVNVKRNPLSGDVMDFELISPEVNIANVSILPRDSVLNESKSLKGQKIIAMAKLLIKERGVDGIVNKTNELLGQLLEHKIAKRVDKLFLQISKIIAKSDTIIDKYTAEIDEYSKLFKSSGKGPMVHMLKEGKKIVRKLLVTLKYVNEILKEVHLHRKDISPLIIDANRTLKKANHALDGLSRNPILKRALGEKQEMIHGVEIND